MTGSTALFGAEEAVHAHVRVADEDALRAGQTDNRSIDVSYDPASDTALLQSCTQLLAGGEGVLTLTLELQNTGVNEVVPYALLLRVVAIRLLIVEPR